MQAERVLTIARYSLKVIAVAFGKALPATYSQHLLRRTAEPETGVRPYARLDTCMGCAHLVRTRSFPQPLAPVMVGRLIVASWRVDPRGLASGERSAKSAAVVAR